MSLMFRALVVLSEGLILYPATISEFLKRICYPKVGIWGEKHS